MNFFSIVIYIQIVTENAIISLSIGHETEGMLDAHDKGGAEQWKTEQASCLIKEVKKIYICSQLLF